MVDVRTTEEILALHKNWRYIRTDRNKTRYFNDCTCQRCGGTGMTPYYYVDGGVCFECGGSGIERKGREIKVYTPEHEAKLEAQREKRRLEREAKLRAERGQKLLASGFGKEGDIYVIYRVVGNTYKIKDELKARGGRFNMAVGWYFAQPLEGYECQRLEEKDVLNDTLKINWKVKEEVSSLWVENNRPLEESSSEWVGEIGERLDLYLHVDKVFDFDSRFGLTRLHLMSDAAGNVFKWSTSSKFFEEEDNVHLRGTVKDHTEYTSKANVKTKQTVLTRCKEIKE